MKTTTINKLAADEGVDRRTAAKRIAAAGLEPVATTKSGGRIIRHYNAAAARRALRGSVSMAAAQDRVAAAKAALAALNRRLRHGEVIRFNALEAVVDERIATVRRNVRDLGGRHASEIASINGTLVGPARDAAIRAVFGPTVAYRAGVLSAPAPWEARS